MSQDPQADVFPDIREGYVSVIIPAYNAAPYIQETLDSVFSQTYKNFEVIVVNDGSPDTTLLESVLRPYRDRIIYVQQENRGLSGARNTGIRMATGSMIAFLDADDIWMPDYLKVQTEFLLKNPEIDLAYCNAKFFGDSIYAGKEYMDVCPSSGEATASALISRRCHVFVSVTARTQVMRSLWFDESLRSCEDYDCWLRLVAAGYKIGYHRKILVSYRKHNASLSANFIRMAEFNLTVLQKSQALWPEDSEEWSLLSAAKEKKAAELEILRGKSELKSRTMMAAIRHLQAANTYYKSNKIRMIVFLLKATPSLIIFGYSIRGMLSRTYREQSS